MNDFKFQISNFKWRAALVVLFAAVQAFGQTLARNYTAGSGIAITGNVISATGGSGTNSYTAGQGIQITGNSIAAIGNGGGLTNLNATNLTGLLSPVLTFTTNTTSDGAHIFVTGSTVANANNTYNFLSTNSGTGQSIWTNTGNGLILYLNDPGGNVTGFPWVLEHIPNDPNFLYGGLFANLTDNNTGGNWFPNTGPGADVLQTFFGTNASITGYVEMSASNLVYAGTSPQINVWVDSILGNDLLAIGSSFPYKTITNAVTSPRLIHGGMLSLVQGNYPDTGNIFLPQGTVLQGNGSFLTGTSVSVVMTNNCSVNNLTISNGTVTTVHTSSQNISSLVVNTVYAHGAVDGLWMNNVSSLDVINCDLGSAWDALAIFGTGSNALIRVFNSRLSCVLNTNILDTTGMHGVVVGFSGSGKIQMFGGSVSIVNPTNIPYSGGVQGNAAIMLGVNSGSTQTNSSMEIYGTVLSHGTTNASALTAAIYNQAAISITGNWNDVFIQTNTTSMSNTSVFNSVIQNTAVIPTNTVNIGNLTVSGATTLSSLPTNTIPYINSTGLISTLPTGTSGQALVSQGATSKPIWTNFPASGGGITNFDGFSANNGIISNVLSVIHLQAQDAAFLNGSSGTISVGATVFITNNSGAFQTPKLSFAINQNTALVIVTGTTPVVSSINKVDGNSFIIYQLVTPGGTLGTPYTTSISSHTSFSTASTSALDTSTYRAFIVEVQ